MAKEVVLERKVERLEAQYSRLWEAMNALGEVAPFEDEYGTQVNIVSAGPHVLRIGKWEDMRGIILTKYIDLKRRFDRIEEYFADIGWPVREEYLAYSRN